MIDGEELPAGWEGATVRELCGQPQYGHTESATHEAVGPKFLRITDIQDGDVNWDAVPYCACDEPAKYRLADGDIVFARTGATTGKSYLVHNPPEAVFASYLIRIRPGTRVLPEYVWWYFQSSGYWASVFGGIDDGNRPNMNGTKLAALRVPFPKSKAEQRRLVARIETLTTRLDQARQARRAALAEAEMLLPSQLERLLGGTANAAWERCSLGTYVRIVGGFAFKSSTYRHEGVPIVRISNLDNEQVDVAASPRVPESVAKEAEVFRLKPGDVLIALSGATTGKLGVVPPECNGWLLNQRVGKFQPRDAKRVHPRFLFWAAKRVQKIVLDSAYGGAQPNISPKDIEAMEFAFPPFDEQRLIAERIDALATKQAELRRLQTETEADFNSLIPAVLAKAFQGKL
jgi:type I restriction enzyme S subunit